MEYRLTFPTLAIGPLAVSLSILMTAWILGLSGRNRRKPRDRIGSDGGRPVGDGCAWCDHETRRGPATDPFVSDGPRASGITPTGPAGRGEFFPAPRRRAG
jgi:hypothetical protein